jgi:hypothetical protein
MTPPSLKEKNAYHGALHLVGAKVDEFAHKCHPPLRGDTSSTVSVILRSTAVRNSVHFLNYIKRVLLPIHKYEECK